MYLKGPCKNQAVIVEDSSAQACVLNMDSIGAKEALDNEQSSYPDRPLILLSIAVQEAFNAIYVRKPIQQDQMLAALKDTRLALINPPVRPAVVEKQPADSGVKRTEQDHSPESGVAKSENDSAHLVASAGATRADVHSTGHKAALLLDERSYASFIGTVHDIDPTDPVQRRKAFYNPKEYLQAYAQSAIKLALSKNRILRLNTCWKPIIILPHSREVWIDADDKQLRAFCVVPIKKITNVDVAGSGGKGISITVVKNNDATGLDPEKFQRMDAFIWKLALWSSAGRVPQGIDFDTPIYIRHWPNMTRLIVPPHALRITALLIDQPRSLINIAEVLQVKQQYVFAFFSAARALGLSGQAVRQADITYAPAPRVKKESSGLLQKILGRLRRK